MNLTRWRYPGKILLSISDNEQKYDKTMNKAIVLHRWVTETLDVVVTRSFLHKTLFHQSYDKQAQVTMLLGDLEEDTLRVGNRNNDVLHPMN